MAGPWSQWGAGGRVQRTGAGPMEPAPGRGGTGRDGGGWLGSRCGMRLPVGVRERVAAVHGGSALPERLRLYDGWADRYEQVPRPGGDRWRAGRVRPFRCPAPLTSESPQDVAALEYRAPHLAAASLAFAFPAPPAEARLLDVACGTGLVAREVPGETGRGREGRGGERS